MIAPGALLTELRRRGVRFELDGDDLVVETPDGLVSDPEWDALKTSKPRLLKTLGDEARLLGMSLAEFEQADHSIEIRVPWLDETLFFVPRAEHIAEIANKGVHRGRVFTAQDLTNLTTVIESSPDRQRDLQNLTRLKVAFDAEILSCKSDPPASCRSCHGTDTWTSIYGVHICRVCHPPASPDLVVKDAS